MWQTARPRATLVGEFDEDNLRKLSEYLQLGRPIVASDNPGNVAIAEKYPGRITLFKSGDVDDLVRALKM